MSARSAAPRLVVIGVARDAGPSLARLLTAIGPDVPFPIVVVTHADVTIDGGHRAAPGEPLVAGRVYRAPIGHDVRVDGSERLALVAAAGGDVPPPIEALFASAAAPYGRRLVAIVLGDAGADGAAGLAAARRGGALTVLDQAADGPRGSTGDYLAEVAPRSSYHVLAVDAIAALLRRVATAPPGPP